jgi:hypothetical protein
MTAVNSALPSSGAGVGSYQVLASMSRPSVDTALVQRLILAFTTGLFLSCAARVSASSAAVVNPGPAVTSRR